MVDFTANWCPPCRVLAPLVDALADEFAAQVLVAKVNVDDQPDLASRCGVLSLPTLVFFRGGQAAQDQATGADGELVPRSSLEP